MSRNIRSIFPSIKALVAYLQDYIRLQKLRKDNNYEVAVNIQSDIKGFEIVPLLLIPFVENAFKHISHHQNNKNFVHVDLARNNGSFSFCVENSKENQLQKTLIPGGIGLNNVKRRLELLYPDKHNLTIDNNEQTFKVQLELQI